MTVCGCNPVPGQAHWQEYRQYRLNSCNKFLAVALVHTRNADRIGDIAQESIRRGNRKRKWIMFTTIQGMVQQRREWMLLSRAFHIEKRTPTMGANAYNRWVYYKTFVIRMRRLKVEAIELWSLTRRKKVVAQLRRLVGVRKWFVAATTVALQNHRLRV